MAGSLRNTTTLLSSRRNPFLILPSWSQGIAWTVRDIDRWSICCGKKNSVAIWLTRPTTIACQKVCTRAHLQMRPCLAGEASENFIQLPPPDNSVLRRVDSPGSAFLSVYILGRPERFRTLLHLSRSLRCYSERFGRHSTFFSSVSILRRQPSRGF